jgi:hypothetical protein
MSMLQEFINQFQTTIHPTWQTGVMSTSTILFIISEYMGFSQKTISKSILSFIVQKVKKLFKKKEQL